MLMKSTVRSCSARGHLKWETRKAPHAGKAARERNSQQACNSAAGLKASGPFRTTLNKRLLYSERLQRQIPTQEKWDHRLAKKAANFHSDALQNGKNQKWSWSLSWCKWIHKLWYVNRTDYYSSVKKKKKCWNTARWMNLKNIMPDANHYEAFLTQKGPSCRIPFMHIKVSALLCSEDTLYPCSAIIHCTLTILSRG